MLNKMKLDKMTTSLNFSHDQLLEKWKNTWYKVNQIIWLVRWRKVKDFFLNIKFK